LKLLKAGNAAAKIISMRRASIYKVCGVRIPISSAEWWSFNLSNLYETVLLIIVADTCDVVILFWSRPYVIQYSLLTCITFVFVIDKMQFCFLSKYIFSPSTHFPVITSLTNCTVYPGSVS